MINIYNGSIFEIECDLLILPCSSSGHMTNWVKKEIRDRCFPTPKYNIDFGDVEFLSINNNDIYMFIGYAASVNETYSRINEIEIILDRIIEFSTNNSVNVVNLPVLGTGAGSLKAHKVIELFISKLNEINIIFIVCIPDGNIATVHMNSNNSYAKEKKMNRVEYKNNIEKSKIFIVHGHDDYAKETVARFIEKLGYEPIILHEQASSGDTIIEKIEKYSSVGFAIVLYTPCDEGRSKKTNGQFKSRARQNVIFEHGYLIGKIGRSKVCALVKDDMETPNDISGIVYTKFDTNGGWKISLCKELKEAGYEFEMNSVF